MNSILHPEIDPQDRLKGHGKEKLLLVWAQGDANALPLFFKNHGKQLLRLVRSWGLDEHSAHSVLTEAVINFEQGFSRIADKDQTKEYAWRYFSKTLQNELLQLIRKEKTKERADTKEAEFDKFGNEDHPSFNGQVKHIRDNFLLLEQMQAIARDELSEIDQQILEMHFNDGMTFESIGMTLGYTSGGIKSRYYRTLRRIKGKLLIKQF